MKTKIVMKNPNCSVCAIVLVLALSLWSLGISTASAQTYSIDWFTIDGGGARARVAFIPSAAPSANRMRGT